ALLDLGPLVIAGDFLGLDGDGAGRTDEFTELAGDAALAIMLIFDEGGGPAAVPGELGAPSFLEILHLDRGATRENAVEVGQGHPQSGNDAGEVEMFPELQFGTFYDDGHA